MLILAIDTSGRSLSVALTRAGELLGETTLNIGLRHSVTALPLIHDLCARCEVEYEAIDAYACAIGPGSYTGIRIGISTIKGMAYAAKKPAVGISSLEVLAAGAGPASGAYILPMLDARGSRLFSCVYKNGRLILPEDNLQQTRLAALLEPLLLADDPEQRRLLLTGDGAAANASLAQWPGALQVEDAGYAFRWPRAAIIARLAAERLQTGGDFSPFLLAANYVSLSQAERLRRKNEST